MINWSNVTILFYGVLGTLVLLLIQWLFSLFLPKLPFEVIESLQHVQQTTIDDNYQGDADIYNSSLDSKSLLQPAVCDYFQAVGQYPGFLYHHRLGAGKLRIQLLFPSCAAFRH
jgi:hypothetical protein